MELWHRTAAGSAVSTGLVATGTEAELLQIAAQDEPAGVGAHYTLHLVDPEDYVGFPCPELHPGNAIG